MAQKLSAVQEMELLRFGKKNKHFNLTCERFMFLNAIFLLFFSLFVNQ
jgi:hypothetical protein